MAGFSNASGNATSVQSIPVSTTIPTNSQALVYDIATNTYIPGAAGGAQGPQGPTGAPGAAGANGTNGSQGAQGAQGSLAAGQTSVNLADQSSVPATPTTSSNLVAVTTAGRGLFQQQNESGAPYFVATAPWAKPWALITPGSSTTFTANGYAASAQVVGTVGTGAPGAQGISQSITSAASIGAQASVRAFSYYYRAQSPTTNLGGFFYYSKVYLPDASYTSTNLLAGMTSLLSADLTNPRSTSQSRAAFQYSNGGGTYTDTTWQFSTASGSAQTTTDTTLALTAGHVYEFYIWCANNASTIYWQAANLTTATTQSGSTGSTLPAVAAGMGPALGCYTYTAATRIINVERVYVEADLG